MRTNISPMTKKQVFVVLRSKQFWLEVVDAVESMAMCHFKSQAAADPSINTLGAWALAIEEDKRQQTSALTVRFAYDFEAWIQKVAMDSFGMDILPKDESIKGNDFRVRTIDQGILPFEVKTTQNISGWTGSTHSEGRGKADNYVLASFSLDLGYPIDSDPSSLSMRGVITHLHSSVLGDDIAVSWNGKATDSNSSTTGKIPSAAHDSYLSAIAFGTVKQHKVWCRCDRESLDEYRQFMMVAA